VKRTRRSRVSLDKHIVVEQLRTLALKDEALMDYLKAGQRNRAFGRLLHKWMDESQESVIDRYIDDDAIAVTSLAINVINKSLQNLTTT
jgi:hypothetical protein